MNQNTFKSEEENTLDLSRVLFYCKEIVKRWWAVVLAAVLCAAVGFGIAAARYVPQYTSSIMFVANNKAPTTSVAGQTSSDIMASASLAESFKYVLTTSSTLLTKVAENSGYKISAGDVSSFVSVSAVEDTSIMYLSVTTTDPKVSYAVAKSYAENYQETLDKAFPSTTMTVVDAPAEPTAPNANNDKTKFAILGFFIGAILACAYIALFTWIKDTVKSAEDIRKSLGLSVIGSVARIERKGKGNTEKPILVTDKNSGFAFIETFKIIRTKLGNLAEKSGKKTFLITSTFASEGKTTTAANIAITLAQAGKSVLLIDGDLRKPSVAKTVGYNAAGEKGLYGVITGEFTLADSIKYYEKQKLFLLVSSVMVENPPEVLSKEIVGDIIQAAEKEFDYVIIDSAPAEFMADAAVLGQYADGILFVIRRNVAPMRKIRKAMENMDVSGTEVLGCIYNDAEKSLQTGTGYGSGKYGYGHYGYGSYTDENGKKKRKF